MRQSYKTDTPAPVNASAGSASLGNVPVVPLAAAAGVECVLLPGCRRLPDPATWRHSKMRLPFCFRSFPCCGKPYRTGPPAHSTPSLQSRSTPSPTPPEVCLVTRESDIGREHGTTTTHVPDPPPRIACNTTSMCCWVGSTWHLHRIVAAKTKQTNKFSLQNNTIKFQNIKTCWRRAGANVHLKAAFQRFGNLSVFSGEDTMQKLPAQERLLTGDAQQFRLNPRPALRVRLGASDPGVTAERRSSHGDGGCRRLC